MKHLIYITILITSFLLAGCGTVHKSSVVISDVEDALMKEWARAHNDHLTTPALDTKVINAHTKFNEAKKIAAAALRTYEADGEQDAYFKALNALRAALDPLFELLNPVVSEARMSALKSMSKSAVNP